MSEPILLGDCGAEVHDCTGGDNSPVAQRWRDEPRCLDCYVLSRLRANDAALYAHPTPHEKDRIMAETARLAALLAENHGPCQSARREETKMKIRALFDSRL